MNILIKFVINSFLSSYLCFLWRPFVCCTQAAIEPLNRVVFAFLLFNLPNFCLWSRWFFAGETSPCTQIRLSICLLTLSPLLLWQRHGLVGPSVHMSGHRNSVTTIALANDLALQLGIACAAHTVIWKKMRALFLVCGASASGGSWDVANTLACCRRHLHVAEHRGTALLHVTILLVFGLLSNRDLTAFMRQWARLKPLATCSCRCLRSNENWARCVSLVGSRRGLDLERAACTKLVWTHARA